MPLMDRPFLVAGEEERDRAVELLRPRLDVVERRRGEAGDGALHVGCAAAVEDAAGNLRGEGRMAPQRDVARRHDIDMAGESRDEAARRRRGRRDCRPAACPRP